MQRNQKPNKKKYDPYENGDSLFYSLKYPDYRENLYNNKDYYTVMRGIEHPQHYIDNQHLINHGN